MSAVYPSPSFNMVYRVSQIAGKEFLIGSFHYSCGVARYTRKSYRKNNSDIPRLE